MQNRESTYFNIWKTTLLIKLNQGFGVGLSQFVYRVFLFDHFGGGSFAIKFVALLVILNSLFTLLLEVPTGAIGDYVGRKKAVIISFVFMSLCFLLKTTVFFSMQVNVSILLAISAEILNAFGYTFFSGTFFAWLVDTIRINNIAEGHGPLMAKGTSYVQVGRIIGAAISLTAYLLGHIYIALSLGTISFMLIAVYLGITMKESEKMKFYAGGLPLRQSLMRMKEIIVIGARSCIQNPPILYLIVLNAIAQMSVYAVLFLWGIVMNVSFGVEKMNLYWYLIVFGSFLSSFVGARLVNHLHSKHFHTRLQRTANQVQWKWVVTVSFILAGTLIGLGLFKLNDAMTISLFIGIVLAVNFSFGFLWPAVSALFNYFIPEKLSAERATIMSFSAMIESLVLMLLFYPTSGLSGENTVIGWMIPATLLLIATIITNFLMRRYFRKMALTASLNPRPVQVLKNPITT